MESPAPSRDYGGSQEAIHLHHHQQSTPFQRPTSPIEKK
jgi:hypothetical protein